MNELETWIQRALWFYHTCGVQFGSDAVCKEAYALGTLVAVGIVAWLLVLLARRNFRAWREMKFYEQHILARRQSTPPDMMKGLKRPRSRSGTPTLPYHDPAGKIKEERAKRTQDGSGSAY